MIHENPFLSPLPRHCQALTCIFFFQFFNQLHSLISIQLSSLINKNCSRVAPKLQEELHFLVLFSMIGKLSDDNYLLCRFQVVSTTFQVMEKEFVELPLVVRWGVSQGQVTILSFQSFLFIKMFFLFQIILSLFHKAKCDSGRYDIHKQLFLQGYFQALYTCIERVLSLLQVKNLMLPTVVEGDESLQTSKFKFHKMEQDELFVSHPNKGLDISIIRNSNILDD